MEFYIHLMSIVFFGFYGPMQCQNICENIRDETVCCINFHMENGECVGCPLGTYGVNCSEPCPEGNYGEFCVFKCSCAEDEICDISYGCLDNSTEAVTISLFHTELQSTQLHTTQRLESKEYTEFPAVPLFLYFVCGGVGFVSCMSCLLVIHQSMCHTRRRIAANNEVNLECARQEVLPEPVEENVDEMMSEHEYLEIIDVDVDCTYLEPCSVQSV